MKQSKTFSIQNGRRSYWPGLSLLLLPEQFTGLFSLFFSPHEKFNVEANEVLGWPQGIALICSGGFFFLLQQILSTMLKQQTGLPESSASFFVFVLIGLQLVKHFRAKPGYYGVRSQIPSKAQKTFSGCGSKWEEWFFFYFFFVVFFVHAIKRVEMESVFPFFVQDDEGLPATMSSSPISPSETLIMLVQNNSQKKSPDLNSVVLAKYTQQPTSFSGMSFFQSPC